MTIKIILTIVFIFALFLIPRILLADQSAKENQSPGLIEGKLQSCPDKPNCISTDYPDNSSHYLPPLDFPDSAKDQIMPLAETVILKMGGAITKKSTKADNNYLAATFTSSLFSFVDDFELRQDNTTLQLHIRSASRSGYSDFGVNKRRVIQFSEQFQIILNNK